MSGAVGFQALREFAHLHSGTARDGFEDISGRREPGLNAGVGGMHAAGNDAADTGDQLRLFRHRDDAGRGADDVDDIALAAAGADCVPMRVEGSDGNRYPGLQSHLRAHFSESVPAMESEVRYSPPILSRIPSKSGSTLERNDCGGRPFHFGFHIHLCPMAQMLRFTLAGSVTPESVAATMSQCSSAVAKRCALLGIVPQPVQQLGEAPLVRVDVAAPVDGLEVFGERQLCDLAGLFVRAVIAP